MKKIFRLFAAFAATTMAFSCMEEANPEAGIQNGGSKFEGPMVTLTFSVDELTKTSYDKENGHQWSEGDQIKIVYGTEDDAFTVADVVDGMVTAEVGDVDTYYAVYPATAEHRFDTPAEASEPKFSVRIPRNQDGSFEMANLMSAQTTKDALSLDFKNLTHIIKFNLTDGHGFDVIEFCANSEVILTGRYFVDVTADGVSMEYNKEGNTNSKYITVNKLAGKSGDFYVGLLPEADMSTGVVLRGKKTGEDWKYYAISMNPLATTRSAITKIGAVDSYLRENVWYITETGTGDGSKDNPAGISKLIELMNKITLSDGTKTKTMHQWRLCNAVVNLAAGTYNIPAANSNATFEPNGLTEYADLTIKGEEGTVLTTVANANVRIIRFNNVKAGNITFDGITFQGIAEGVSSVGVGTYCSGTTTGTLNYNNCKFIDFNSTATNKGAAVLCAGDGERTLNFTKCTFENNVSTGKCEGVISTTASETTINLIDCSFQNNGTLNGGAVYAAAGVVNINGSIFNSNTAINGGAAYINGGTVSFGEGCEFTSNVATTELDKTDAFGGAICVKKGDVTIDGVTFTGNSAQNYGGAVHASGVEISIKNSSFTGNNSACGGALSNEIGVMIVDGCSFKENGSVSKAGMGGAIASYDEYPKAVYPIGIETQKSANAAVESGKIATLYLYNSEFDGNYYYKNLVTDNQAGGGGQGSAIQVHGLGKMAAVNCSFNGNQGLYGGVIRCRASAAPGSTVYLVSCTGNALKTYHNQNSTAYIYNSITNGYGSGGTHVTKYYNSIKATELWQADGTKATEAVVFADQIGAFADGVFPANGAAATNGMSSTDLAALGAEGSALMTAMPLFETKYLTVDQKGNSREGKTVMGAFVGQ